MRVILADDSDLILVRLQQMLSIFPQVDLVGSYSDGIETLNAIKKLKPDLAILDIRMPLMSGLDVLKEIRKDYSGIKIILLTLYSSEYYREQAFLFGADYFFSKVDDFEKVSITVAGIIKKELNEYKN
ncbi:MAG: response regulator transcription factor [Bacteroidales bacterium]|nr:response regulator transcription factor [Bacteroidales bacterium]